MASLLSTRFVSRLGQRTPARHAVTGSWLRTAFYSSDAPSSSPPLLAKLKGDLKAAMKAKDAARLTVLRSVLAATLNASKTATPIRTDTQLVGLLRKTARASRDAADEFRQAGRADLAEKEESQIQILDEYCAGSGVQSLSDADLQQIVHGVLGQLKAEGIESKSAMGEAMKRLLQPGGPLDGKDIDKAAVTKLVKETVASS
jgi:uncharacterized protein YqeY